MSFLQEAFDWIKNHGEIRETEVHDRTVFDRQVFEVEAPLASKLHVHTLSAVVEYVKSEFDTDKKLLVHIVDAETVTVYDALNVDKNRSAYIQASAYVPSFDFDRFYDAETINVKLQSVFVQNEDRDILLKTVGNIKEDAVQTIGDDGISQAVTAKTGVASVGTVKVINPVTLAPYRTFAEVPQPESQFVFRMQSGPKAALFEADGGAWRNKAIQNIEDYLTGELVDALEAGKVTIIA